MVEHGHAQRSCFGGGEPFSCMRELSSAQRAALMAKRARRVEAYDMQAGHRRGRLGRLPDALELRPGTDEARRRVGDVVVARHSEHGRPERTQQLRGPVELPPAAAMSKIPRRHDELRLQPLYEPREGTFDLRLRMCTGVQIGNMEEPCGHNRTRL